MLLLNKLLIICLLLSLAVISGGCWKDSQIEQLRRENPFIPDPNRLASNPLFITCKLTMIEFPAQVDLTRSDFWKSWQCNAAPGSHAGIISGFDESQIKILQNNGFKVAVAPIERWEALRQSLTNTGGQEFPTRLSLFRNAAEVLDVPGYWTEQERPLFISESGQTLRGYSLPQGNFLLKVFCTPAGPDQTISDQVYVRLVPAFAGAPSQSRLVETPAGIIREPVSILFEPLALAGVIRNQHFIVLIADPAQNDKVNLGNFCLKQQGPQANVRLLIALSPMASRAIEGDGLKNNRKLPKNP